MERIKGHLSKLLLTARFTLLIAMSAAAQVQQDGDVGGWCGTMKHFRQARPLPCLPIPMPATCMATAISRPSGMATFPRRITRVPLYESITGD